VGPAGLLRLAANWPGGLPARTERKGRLLGGPARLCGLRLAAGYLPQLRCRPGAVGLCAFAFGGNRRNADVYRLGGYVLCRRPAPAYAVAGGDDGGVLLGGPGL